MAMIQGSNELVIYNIGRLDHYLDPRKKKDTPQ
jgi:hypothetical protein